MIALVALAALAAGYLFWLRDSSLVAVDDVEVVGVTGGEREQIVAELTRVGEQMTTLHVDPERIERAAARFPTIASVSVDPNFPHGLRIEVTERPPRLLVSAGGEQVPVAADGTLLAGVPAPEEGLPVLELDQVPAAGSLGGAPLEQALVVGAAPEPLRPLIEKIEHSDDYGVEITLRGEIPVRFGTGARAAEKWAAAAAVLADPKLDALTYVDVRVPERPAVGGGGVAAAARRASSLGRDFRSMSTLDPESRVGGCTIPCRVAGARLTQKPRCPTVALTSRLSEAENAQASLQPRTETERVNS